MIAEHAVRALYVTPHHQFPTTVTLSAGRRLKLLELARAHRFAIVEDDYDYDFHYDGRPVLPLASVDPAGVVVYVGTLRRCSRPRCASATSSRPLHSLSGSPRIARTSTRRATRCSSTRSPSCSRTARSSGTFGA